MIAGLGYETIFEWELSNYTLDRDSTEWLFKFLIQPKTWVDLVFKILFICMTVMMTMACTRVVVRVSIQFTLPLVWLIKSTWKGNVLIKVGFLAKWIPLLKFVRVQYQRKAIIIIIISSPFYRAAAMQQGSKWFYAMQWVYECLQF